MSSKRLKSVFVLRNGSLAVFDSDGGQVQELQLITVQDLIANESRQRGYDIIGCTVEIHGGWKYTFCDSMSTGESDA